MSKVSDQFHKVYHTHHDKKATVHAGHAAAHKAMMDDHEEGTPEHTYHKTKHALHKAAHESHVVVRDYHKACMEKAAGDEMNKSDSPVPASLESHVRAILVKMLGDTLVPTAVSAVAPSRPGIIAVPRAGEQPVPARLNVPEQFQKMVEVEHTDEPSLRQ
jgi:hypothetical protein